jgi:hypothetical protein
MGTVKVLVATCVLATCLFASLASTADPLHQVGNEGAWRHEYSGWQFAKQVGEFSRVMAPYTIDGNNDAGVRYEYVSDGSRVDAVVEIYLADSAAPDAKLDGAKASAAHKAGDAAKVQAKQPFRIASHESMHGTKITYAVNGKASGPQTSLYFFEANRWTVKVLGSVDSASADAGKVLDGFVRALPWDTLGDPTALH